MSQRSKNLLEAFNRSKAPEKSPEPAPTPRGSTPRVGGPFADSTPAAKPAAKAAAAETRAAPGLYDPRPAPAGTHDRRRVAILCVLVAAIFFLLGRLSVSSGPTANAAESGAEGTAVIDARANRIAPPSAPPRTPPARTHEEALKDSANQVTILASTYKLSDDQRKLALAACGHLLGLGYPAAVYEHPPKKQIYLLVGAAAAGRELDDMLTRVRSAVSARGVREFTTAQVVSIDKYVIR